MSDIIHETESPQRAGAASAGQVEGVDGLSGAPDVRSIWRAPSWAADSRVGDGCVYHCLEEWAVVQPRTGESRPLAAGVVLCQTDTVTITDGRIRAVRGRTEVLLEDLTMTLEQAEAMAGALLRLVAAGRAADVDARGGVR